MMPIYRASLSGPLLVHFATAQAGPYTLTASDNTLVYTVTQQTGGDIPLAQKNFDWPNLPYQADSGDGPRGRQQGYNICNSTTLGEKSMCQTAWINSIDDFCLWGSPMPNSTVGEGEEQLVAYCSMAKHGTRVLSPGALTGVQFMRAHGYVEVVGFLDQALLNLQNNDVGGEEDPHGADERGNPLGGLVYSNAFGGKIQQVVQWWVEGVMPNAHKMKVYSRTHFVGSGVFCFKACDPTNPEAYHLCNNRYDRVGCAYNMPADYAKINGTFETCAGDDQFPVGVYLQDGQTRTWTQPPEGQPVSPPYTAAIPSSSQCSSRASSDIFSDLASYYASASSSSSSSSASSASATGGSAGIDTTSTAASATSHFDNGSAALLITQCMPILLAALAIAVFA